MSKSPIIILAGNAGSGKDTVGAYLAEKYGAVTVAQADPLKRFAAEVFGFSEEQLWGPSSSRNAPDPKTVEDRLTISAAFSAYELQAERKELFGQVIPKNVDLHRAMRRLQHWFEQLYHNLENGIPVSSRLVLQTLGGDWGRNVSQNMWNDYANATCLRLLSGGVSYSRTEGLMPDPTQGGYDFAGITDGRYRNEIVLTTMKGGSALRINRVNPDKAAVEAGGVKGHKSETELDKIPSHFFTGLIENDRDLACLYASVDFFMNRNYEIDHYKIDRYANGAVRRG